MTRRQRMQAVVYDLIQRLPLERPQTLLELIAMVAHAEGVDITPYSCEPDGERCSGFVRRTGLKSYGVDSGTSVQDLRPRAGRSLALLASVMVSPAQPRTPSRAGSVVTDPRGAPCVGRTVTSTALPNGQGHTSGQAIISLGDV